jgi:hypothetical protein
MVNPAAGQPVADVAVAMDLDADSVEELVPVDRSEASVSVFVDTGRKVQS